MLRAGTTPSPIVRRLLGGEITPAEALPALVLLAEATPLLAPSLRDVLTLALRAASACHGVDHAAACAPQGNGRLRAMAWRGQPPTAESLAWLEAHVSGERSEPGPLVFEVAMAGVLLVLERQLPFDERERRSLSTLVDALEPLIERASGKPSVFRADRLHRAAAVLAEPCHDVRGMLVPISVLTETFSGANEEEWRGVQEQVLSQIEEIDATLTQATEAVGARLSREPRELSPIVDNALRRVPFFAYEVEPTLHLHASRPVVVDALALELALTHLLQRALDESGGHGARIEIRSEDAGTSAVRISLRDDEENAEVRRQAAGSALVEAGGGSLAIAARIIRKLGGTLTFERSDGGTLTSFSLPAAA